MLAVFVYVAGLALALLASFAGLTSLGSGPASTRIIWHLLATPFVMLVTFCAYHWLSLSLSRWLAAARAWLSQQTVELTQAVQRDLVKTLRPWLARPRGLKLLLAPVVLTARRIKRPIY